MAERQRVRSDGRQETEKRLPVTAAEAGRCGLRQIAELTGKELEGVTGVEPTEDGWLVTVEVVESRRIPASSDLLATYETDIGPDSELVSYRRVQRYARGDTYKDGP
jgi:hypothetical protein